VHSARNRPFRGAHRYGHLHSAAGRGRTDKTAGDRRGLADVARHGDRNEVEPADAAIGRIEHDPTGAGHVDLGPGVGRAAAGGPEGVQVGVVQIAGHDPRAEPQASDGIDEQHREIAARAPTPRASVSTGV